MGLFDDLPEADSNVALFDDLPDAKPTLPRVDYWQQLYGVKPESGMESGGDFARALFVDLPEDTRRGLSRAFEPIESGAATLFNQLKGATEPETEAFLGANGRPAPSPGPAAMPSVPMIKLPLASEPGTLGALSRFAEGLTTPGNLVTLPLTISSKPLQAALALQAASGVPGALQRTGEDPAGGVTEAVLQAGLAALMGRGALKEKSPTAPREHVTVDPSELQREMTQSQIKPAPEKTDPYAKYFKEPAEAAPRHTASRKDLSNYGDKLYRESSIDNAVEYIPGNKIGRIQIESDLVSNAPELALGQGQNKGVLLEFDSMGLTGTPHSEKPSSGFVEQQGRYELALDQSRKDASKNLSAVTVAPGTTGERAQLFSRLLSGLERQGWEKKSNPDGSVTYRKPVSEAVPTPEKLDPHAKYFDDIPEVSKPSEFVSELDRVASLTPGEFSKEFTKGFTETAIALGEKMSPEEILPVLNRVDAKMKAAQEKAIASKSEADMQTFSDLAYQRQFVSEALQGAQNKLASAPPEDAALAASVESLEAQPQVSRGPGAAAAGEPGTYSAVQQLADQIRVTAPNEAPIEQQLSVIDRVKTGAASLGDSVKDAAAKAVAVKDALWDAYAKLPKFTEEQRSVGRWTYALQKADAEARDFAKAITKAVPNKLRREAIVNWIQADGDLAILRDRADASKAAFKAGYVAAQNLTTRELEIAQLVREYYDRQLERGINEGILKDGLESYVTQVWKRENPITRKLQNELSAGKLQPNFKFARKRIFDSYFEGEQAGYPPASKDIGALVAFYDQSFNKSLAARAFLKELHEGKASDGRPLVEVSGSGKVVEQSGGRSLEQGKSVMIKPHSKPDEIADYRVIDHPALRGWKWVTQTPEGSPVLLQGDLLVHPEVYQKLRNRLSISAWRQNPAGRALLNTQSTVKQTMLSVSGFHQAQETLHALGHRVNPANLETIDFSEPVTKALVEHGLQLADYHAMEAFAEGLASGPLLNKIPWVGSKILKPYTEWLFQDYIPRLKLTMAKHALERNMERYTDAIRKGEVTQDQVLEMTANQGNAAFGELNYRYMGRNPTLQDTLRAFLLAPDFLEARGRFVGQAVKPGSLGVKGYLKNEQMQALGLLAATLYITARVTNQAIDGEPHWEAKHAFSIVYKGHSYTLRSVPGDLIHLFSSPRTFWYHRLSPIIGRGSIEALTGRDDRGVKRGILEQAKDMLTNVVPISLRQRDDMKLWESFLNAFGVGTQRYDSIREIGDRAKEFKDSRNVKEPFEFIYDPDGDAHRPLRVAITNGDAKAAREAYSKLLSTEKKKNLDESIHNYFTKPFTSSKTLEREFVASLDESGKKKYEEAQALRRERLRFFNEMVRGQSAP